MNADFSFLTRLAFQRRLLLACGTVALVLLAALPMARMLAAGGWTAARIVFFALFLLLFAQVVFAFLVAGIGFWVLRTGRHSLRIADLSPLEPPPMPLPATAIVMPVHNEEVERVFQGLRAMYVSLQKHAGADAFDFFILSDTDDPNHWIAEEKAWLELCKEVGGFGRIFYRKRRMQLHHKSGNIADFCRRWGASYRYMIVLDADSLMTDSVFVRLAALMERNPGVGIIQTTTYPMLGQTLFQRIEQFSAAVYRPVITAGLNFWQLMDASFWGHNAIVRLKPFMEFCALPELPEVGPLGTRILSHDTIESALMRKAGYQVWQTCDADGSYEETPPHLLAGLQRDRRWCHGNLQHLWFLFERGIRTTSRFNILNGILAYANAPLWLLSILLGSLIALRSATAAAPARPGGFQPAVNSAGLYAGVILLLLTPKILGAAIFLRSAEQVRRCGGRARVILGMVLETIYSFLLGPILMLFYTRFVLASFRGIPAKWGRQIRSDDEGPRWSVWLAFHWQNTLLALAALYWVAWLNPALLPWLIPVFIGPLVALPLSKITASARLGRAAKVRGWFLTPVETAPPPDLATFGEPFTLPVQPFFLAPQYVPDYGLLQAVLDPYLNSLHVSMLRLRKEGVSLTREYLSLLANRLLSAGPLALTPAEKTTLLWDSDAMLFMHQTLWSSPAAHLHEWWQAAFRHYVETSELSVRRIATL